MPTAILVDAAFFLRRLPRVYPNIKASSAPDVAKRLYQTSLEHLNQKIGGKANRRELYRLFVYDCPPLKKKAHYPVSRKSVDFSKDALAIFRDGLHSELIKLRKVALRLGRLSENAEWRIHPNAMKDLISGKRTLQDIGDNDFLYETKQKGVDIRIGLDIASLAFKKQVDQIILISGDADFVPAAKMARREGIDFVLDPMWSAIGLDLTEHIDGLRSTCPRPPATPEPLIDAVEKATPDG